MIAFIKSCEGHIRDWLFDRFRLSAATITIGGWNDVLELRTTVIEHHPNGWPAASQTRWVVKPHLDEWLIANCEGKYLFRASTAKDRSKFHPDEYRAALKPDVVISFSRSDDAMLYKLTFGGIAI